VTVTFDLSIIKQ